MNVQDILQELQKRTTPISTAETRKILDGVRAEAETQLNAVMVGVLMHHKAQTMAKELEVTIADAEATAQTMNKRFSKLQQQVDDADFAVRKAKADKIMLPSDASQPDHAQADRAIRDAERALQTARSNLQSARTVAEQRQRELDDLKSVHRALAGVGLPDITPIRVLLDVAR